MFLGGEQDSRFSKSGVHALILPPYRDAIEFETHVITLAFGPNKRFMEAKFDFLFTLPFVREFCSLERYMLGQRVLWQVIRHSNKTTRTFLRKSRNFQARKANEYQ
jgi:hypothetical protein